MNLQQFYSQTIANQGASYSILTGELNPNNGYFVSLANNESQIPLSEFTQQTVKDFISNNADALSTSNHFIGSWIENNIVYLDVSEQIQDLRTALTLGYRRNQLAIYDAFNGVVIDLPSPQRSGTLTQQRSYITSVINRLTNN